MRKYILEAFLAAFSLLIVSTTAAYAQMPPGFEEVSGSYTNEEAGVGITFPEGWSGASFAVNSSLIVSVAPEGMQDSSKGIGIIISDKSQVDAPPTDPSDFTQEEVPECTSGGFNERTVSGRRGYEGIVECTDEEGVTTKVKMVGAESQTRWIVAFYVSPTSEFDADVGKFDAAVNSLTVQNAVDTQIPPPIGTGGGGGTTDGGSSSMISVMVQGAPVEVAVRSSSQVSGPALDEGTKTLKFNLDGSGTSTVVSVGKVLDGPYTVMVDGQATTEFQEGTDDQGVKTVTVPHESGAHEVTITGTQVVPEFPVAVLGVVAALIGIVAVLGRTKLIGRKIP